MNRLTQIILAACGIVTAASVAFIAIQAAPEPERPANLGELNERLDAHFSNSDRAFCKHVRAEVAAGRMTITPGGNAEGCL